MSNLIHFLNGKFVTENELLISPRDLGFVRGYAINDYVITFNHKPFKLSEHIDRLFRSAEIYGLSMPWTKNQIATWIQETLLRNDKEIEKRLKIIVSGGASHGLYQAEIPTIMMIVDEYTDKPASYYENGVKSKTAKYKRPYPAAKHTYHAAEIKELTNVRNQGVTEIIFYDDTQVFEAGGSNIFAVIDKELVTTKSNIVEGLIRNTLLDILHLNIPIDVRDFTFRELQNADEVFLTGSKNGSIGVVEIDGTAVGDGKVGEITKEVANQYKKYIISIT